MNLNDNHQMLIDEYHWFITTME